jgi:hypothetical protein
VCWRLSLPLPGAAYVEGVTISTSTLWAGQAAIYRAGGWAACGQ